MVQMTKAFVVVSETDYYGLESRRSVVVGESGMPVEYGTQQEAEEAATDYNPDYDPSVDCCRLVHNQASPTRGRVAELVTDGFDAGDWTSFEDCASDLWEAAAAYEKSGVEPDEALSRAIGESNYVVGPDGESLYRIL